MVNSEHQIIPTGSMVTCFRILTSITAYPFPIAQPIYSLTTSALPSLAYFTKFGLALTYKPAVMGLKLIANGVGQAHDFGSIQVSRGIWTIAGQYWRIMEYHQEWCLLIIIWAAITGQPHIPDPRFSYLPRQNLIFKWLRNGRPIDIERCKLVVVIELFALVVANDI